MQKLTNFHVVIKKDMYSIDESFRNHVDGYELEILQKIAEIMQGNIKYNRSFVRDKYFHVNDEKLLRLLREKADKIYKSAVDLPETQEGISLRVWFIPFLSESEQIKVTYEKIVNLSRGIFKLDPMAREAQTGTLGGMASPELQRLQELKEQNPLLKDDPHYKLAVSLEKFKIAYSLGVNPKNAGGENGCLIYRDVDDTILGFFKPVATGNFLKSVKEGVGQAQWLDTQPNKEQQAEVAMDLLDSSCSFGMTPHAMMCHAIDSCGQSVYGAFVEPLVNYKTLKSFRESASKHLMEQKEYPGHAAVTKWQKLNLLIFITTNLDPHDDNIFIRMDSFGCLLDCKLIDAGNAIRLEKHPEQGFWNPRGYTGYRENPASFNISNWPFTDETKQFISNNLTADNLKKAFRLANETIPGFYTSLMVMTIIRNVCILRAIADGSISDIPNPAMLLKSLSLQSHFDALLDTDATLKATIAKTQGQIWEDIMDLKMIDIDGELGRDFVNL
jgi:hypothetical protein